MSYESTDKRLEGRAIVKAVVNGHGITLVLDNGERFEYHASDGGYSCWEFVCENMEGGAR